MEKNAEKTTWAEAFQLHCRGFRDLHRHCPGLFASFTAHALFKALGPLLTIYLSAQIMDELAGLRRAEVLWPLVLVTLGSGALLTLITGGLYHWREAMISTFYDRKDRIYVDKFLSMDFADVDKAETNDLFSQIMQNEQWTGWGFVRMLCSFGDLLQGVFGILGAITLTVSLFTMSVPQTAGQLTVLNHPVFLLLFVGILIGAAGLGPMCKNKASEYWVSCAEIARLGNRIWGAFGFMSADQSRAPDYRMYNQQDIARYYMTKHNTFGIGGELSKLAMGPMGAWSALSSCIGAVMIGVVYVFVCMKAWAGAFGVGAVTQYVGAVTALSKSLSLILEALGMLRNNTPFMKLTYEFLDIPNEMYQGSLTTEKRSDRQYEVEFRDVSFRYPGASDWALRHVNMKFKVGSRLAVVGENGSGKTTFIKLLCRLYDPQEGQILLNGIDIRKYQYDDYMDIFSVVFQDYQLISQPLGENVACSQIYDKARVHNTLNDAGFGERLKTMSKGLDTMLYRDLSEDGVEVSGGEAQKIAIARALYKDAPFIVLDEPTAALDPIAEAEIYEKFNEISGDRTAIYISHRLSSCKFCDEIAVFHGGTVIQQGTHEQLHASEGMYRRLWEAQAQYYTQKQA